MQEDSVPEELDGRAKWDDHEAKGHVLFADNQVSGAYMLFIAKCSCGEKFIVNKVER